MLHVAYDTQYAYVFNKKIIVHLKCLLILAYEHMFSLELLTTLSINVYWGRGQWLSSVTFLQVNIGRRREKPLTVLSLPILYQATSLVRHVFP